jgi:hypothetical protein
VISAPPSGAVHRRPAPLPHRCPGGWPGLVGQPVRCTSATAGRPTGPRSTTLFPFFGSRPSSRQIAKLESADGLALATRCASRTPDVVNYEKFRDGSARSSAAGSANFFDVSTPSRPKLVRHWRVSGEGGFPRCDFDGRFAYTRRRQNATSEHHDGFSITVGIRARRIRTGGISRAAQGRRRGYRGTTYRSRAVTIRCARRPASTCRSVASRPLHPRNISDMSKPTLVSAAFLGPANPHPSHTALRMRKAQGPGHHSPADEGRREAPPFGPRVRLVYDVYVREQPIPMRRSRWRSRPDGAPQPPMMGCHQPAECFNGHHRPRSACSPADVRTSDVADPFAPTGSRLLRTRLRLWDAKCVSNDVTTISSGLCTPRPPARSLP